MALNSRRSFAGAVGISSGATVYFFLRRYLEHVAPPRLVHGSENQSATDELLLQVRALLRDYRPHPILEFSGLLSTIACGPRMVLPKIDDSLGGRLTKWGFLAPPEGHIEELVLEDGGTVSLHWGLEPELVTERQGYKGLVLILPGLNNSSRTPYVQSSMRFLRSQGLHSVAINYRAVDGVPLTTPRVGCADSWQDLPQVFDHMSAKMPDAELFAIGYSMGGGMLLRYLGETGDAAKIRAGATVAAPLDSSAVVANLESTFLNRLFNRALAIGAGHNVTEALEKYPEYRSMIDEARVHHAHSIRDIDEAVVCPLNGYKDSEDYYANATPRGKLDRIRVRTLIMHAEDDPVVGMSTIPVEDVRQNPYLLLATTRRGGHLSWSASEKVFGASWVDRVACKFFASQSSTRPYTQSRL